MSSNNFFRKTVVEQVIDHQITQNISQRTESNRMGNQAQIAAISAGKNKMVDFRERDKSYIPGNRVVFV